MRQAIRDLTSEKQIPPTFCVVIIEGDKIKLEVKNSRKEMITISWEELNHQVEMAREKAANM